MRRLLLMSPAILLHLVIVSLILTPQLQAQNVEGHPVGNECNYHDGRGWVPCLD